MVYIKQPGTSSCAVVGCQNNDVGKLLNTSTGATVGFCDKHLCVDMRILLFGYANISPIMLGKLGITVHNQTICKVPGYSLLYNTVLDDGYVPSMARTKSPKSRVYGLVYEISFKDMIGIHMLKRSEKYYPVWIPMRVNNTVVDVIVYLRNQPIIRPNGNYRINTNYLPHIASIKYVLHNKKNTTIRFNMKFSMAPNDVQRACQFNVLNI